MRGGTRCIIYLLKPGAKHLVFNVQFKLTRSIRLIFNAQLKTLARPRFNVRLMALTHPRRLVFNFRFKTGITDHRVHAIVV